MPNPLSRRLRRRWLPQALAVLLVVTQIQAAEQAAAPPQATRSVPPSPRFSATRLQRRRSPPPHCLSSRASSSCVLAGNGEMNDLERRVMAPLVVQVLDQNDRPMEGAEVVFRFPISGPGATFTGWKKFRHCADQWRRSGCRT